MSLVFLDTETGGFDDSKHPLIEVAWAVENGAVESLFLPHDVRTCDPKALDINGYDARHLGHRRLWADRMKINALWAALRGQTLVMSNPSFDERFLLAYGRAEGLGDDGKVDVWKHRKIDIATYAMPILGHDEPKGLAAIVTELRQRGDYDLPAPDHGARNDVIALRSAYRVLQGLAGVTGISA